MIIFYHDLMTHISLIMRKYIPSTTFSHKDAGLYLEFIAILKPRYHKLRNYSFW